VLVDEVFDLRPEPGDLGQPKLPPVPRNLCASARTCLSAARGSAPVSPRMAERIEGHALLRV